MDVARLVILYADPDTHPGQSPRHSSPLIPREKLPSSPRKIPPTKNPRDIFSPDIPQEIATVNNYPTTKIPPVTINSQQIYPSIKTSGHLPPNQKKSRPEPGRFPVKKLTPLPTIP